MKYGQMPKDWNSGRNGMIAAALLKDSQPSDDIYLDADSYSEIMMFRDDIVGSKIDLISDVIWSETIPLKDFTVSVIGPRRMRFLLFENALNALEDAPEGKPLMIGAVQELGWNSFWLLAVVKGETRAVISFEHYSSDGEMLNKSGEKVLQGIRDLWRLWHGIQLALLHPKVREVFSHPKMAKEYTRKKDATGKRRRQTRYIRRHVIDGDEMKSQLREINRTCLAWYVIGHWRHLKSGKVVYVRGHWRGEMRELQRNIDGGREREIAAGA